MKTLTPNDSGKILVDQCQQVSIKKVLTEYKSELKKGLTSNQVTIDDQVIRMTTSKTGGGGKRQWFTCPLCDKRCGIIYKQPMSSKMGCRTCLNLDYRSRRYKGMIENNG